MNARVLLIERSSWDTNLAAIAERAGARAKRQQKALAGERGDGLAFNELADRLEDEAEKAVADVVVADLLESDQDEGDEQIAPSWHLASATLPASLRLPRVEEWLAQGGAVVVIRSAFGRRPRVVATARPAAPLAVRRSSDAESPAGGLWRAQLAAALSDGAPIVPSGVANDVLVEGLREFVGRPGERLEARVVYRDGSEAAPISLRALALTTGEPTEFTDYPVGLISMRHASIEPLVNGYWFRNRLLSRPRPAAETDKLAYEFTIDRLGRLAERGRFRLLLYQTGFEPANVGFFRAVIDHLSERPETLVVAPRFFRGEDAPYDHGTSWSLS